MHSFLMNTICRTGIFIICAQALVHLRPRGSYEKYLKMLMSAMVLMQLFLPMSTFFTGEGERSLAARVAWFEEQLRQSRERIEQSHAKEESILEQMTLEEVQGRVAENAAKRESAEEPEPIQIAPVGKIEIRLQNGREEQEKQSESIGQERGRTDDAGGE